jgi:outer membrane protein OmpA-like peptidoglycan-associated protein
MKRLSIAVLLAGGALLAQAQERNENADRAAAGLAPIYRVSVTERTAKAISYQHRNGATKIDFRGTSLMPKARGEAKVESKKGYIEVEVEFENLQAPAQYGAEYLTYVLWAITPEGRSSNLGEILRGNGSKGKLNVTTELQAFALVVTAEPYFAVSRPSDVIVLENALRADTIGKVELMDAKYELLQRGQYLHLANVQGLKMDRKIPLEVYEARNAVYIARASGADRYASDTFLKSEDLLKQAEAYHARKAGIKPVIMTARQAVQVAEDARAIGVKRQDEAILTSERQAGADRELRAENSRDAAQVETDRVTRLAAAARLGAQTDAERVKRENDAQAANSLSTANRLRQENVQQATAAQAEAGRVKLASDATLVAAQQEASRLRTENDAKIAAAQTESARLARENGAQASISLNTANRLRQENMTQATNAQAEADRIKLASDATLLAAQTEAARVKNVNEAALATAQAEVKRTRVQDDAKLAASQAESMRLAQENSDQRATLDRVAGENKKLETEKGDLRAQLLVQFNTILQTRDTARGLIVNMSDVIFDPGKSSLRPGAREKLAKVAGIISGHPGLSLAIEGHTDSVGSDTSNQRLSEQRSGSVRDYLLKQGMTAGSVSSSGLGEAQPVATNVTAVGRQQNRRVEIVISGDIIGKAVGVPLASR